MGLHTGRPLLTPEGYIGLDVHRAARVSDAAHGGQILLSQATWDALGDAPPGAVSVRDLGAHRLKDLQQAERLFQLLHPDLPVEFPPVRSLERYAHNLPRQLTSFIGREEAMAAVRRRLADTALVTLTGTGGCGKPQPMYYPCRRDVCA
jgi:hypothetical protein